MSKLTQIPEIPESRMKEKKKRESVSANAQVHAARRKLGDEDAAQKMEANSTGPTRPSRPNIEGSRSM